MAQFSNAIAAGSYAQSLTEITGYLNEVKARITGGFGVMMNPQVPVQSEPSSIEQQRAESLQRAQEAAAARRAEQAVRTAPQAENDNTKPPAPFSREAIAARTESPVPVYEVSARGAVNTTPAITGLLVDQAR